MGFGKGVFLWLMGLTISDDFRLASYPSFLLGLSLILATSIGINFITFAFLIKKYGNDSLRSFLNYISNAKDRFLFNIDLLKINFSKFNKYILCLNSIVLKSIIIFCFFEEKSIIPYFYDDQLVMCYLGFFMICKLLESKQYLPLFISLAMNFSIITEEDGSNDWRRLRVITYSISMQICRATILCTFILGVISLLSFLITSSKRSKQENNAISIVNILQKFLSKLQDAKKIEEYQKVLKFNKRNYIKDKESFFFKNIIITKMIFSSYPCNGKKTKPKRPSSIKNTSTDKDSSTDKKQKDQDGMGKSTIKPLSLNVKYKTHLNSNNQETWNFLFILQKPNQIILQLKGVLL